MDVADHYRGQREALSDWALTLSPDLLSVRVPACPSWTVRDILGHVVALPSDVLAGRMEGAPGPEWTQRQVEERRQCSVAELVDEWSETGPVFEKSLPDMGFRGWVFTYDVTMHGDDLREALGLPLGESETHAVVLDGIIDRARTRASGIGTLILHAGDRSWQLGEGEPLASLTVSDEGELARIIGARRPDDTVRALAWTGDPEPWIPVLPLFRADR